MWTPGVVLLALVTFLACALLGGGLYEYRVLDPVWPGRPAIIQPRNGGVSRHRFWLPAHTAFAAVLVIAIVCSWSHPHVRIALIVTMASYVASRIWSFVDVVPKAAAFERGDPATIDRAAAERWTRRSVFRLPLDAVTCAAALTALVAAA